MWPLRTKRRKLERRFVTEGNDHRRSEEIVDSLIESGYVVQEGEVIEIRIRGLLLLVPGIRRLVQ